jgi:Superinfection immunity protein
MEVLIFFVWLVAILLPIFIAHGRQHHHRVAITVLSILVSWTFLGFVVALVWPACRSRASRRRWSYHLKGLRS